MEFDNQFDIQKLVKPIVDFEKKSGMEYRDLEVQGDKLFLVFEFKKVKCLINPLDLCT